MPASPPLRVFISFRSTNLAWATWICTTLRAHGLEVRYQPEFTKTRSFILQIEEALGWCDRLVVVLSRQYFDSAYTAVEWEAALRRELAHQERTICTVRVEDFAVDGLLGGYPQLDLFSFDLDEAAGCRLLRHVQDGSIASAHAGPRASKRRPLRKAIPQPRPPRLAGREELLGTLADSLCRDRVPLVLKGMPGVGKTALAVELCYRHSERYRQIFWLRAGRWAEDLESLLSDVAPHLLAPEPGAMRESFLAWLDEQESWLLVIDGVDRDADVAAVAPFLTLDRGCVLATSRLGRGHDFARVVAVQPLSRTQATAYLVEEAGPNAGSDDEAARLAQFLGDLPIALEQAGAYLADTRIGFRQYLERVKDSHAVSGAGEAFGGACRLALESLEPFPRALLESLSWLAPSPIPRADLLVREAQWTAANREPGHPAASGLSGPAPAVSLQGLLIDLERRSLLQLDPDHVILHPLLQRTVRALASPETVQIALDAVWETLSQGGSWRHWAPHVEALLGHAERLGLDSDAAIMLSAQLGVHWLRAGQPLAAQPRLQKALDFFAPLGAGGESSPGAAAVLLGRCFLLSGRLPEADILLRRIVEKDEFSAIFTPIEQAAACSELASALRQCGRFDEAEPLYRRACELVSGAGPEAALSVADQMNNLALLLREQGRFAEAEPLLREALQRTRALPGLGARQAQTEGAAWINLATLLRLTGRLDDARHAVTNGLQCWERIDENGPAVFSSAWAVYGLVLLDSRQFPEAEEWLLKARAVHAGQPGEMAWDRMLDACDLAWLYTHWGKFEQARRWLATAREECEALLPPDHWHHGLLLSRRAFYFEKCGQPAEALIHYSHAHRILSSVLGSGHFRTRWVALRRAEVAKGLGPETMPSLWP